MILGLMGASISNVSRIPWIAIDKNTDFKYVQDSGNNQDFDFQYFQDSGNTGDFMVHIFVFISCCSDFFGPDLNSRALKTNDTTALVARILQKGVLQSR